MNVLIIGGTRFVGRHITDALIARGHKVTHFNRGVTDAAARSDIETIHGDRATDLARIGDRRWDAVVDTCGYTPDIVERSTRYFGDKAERYLFVSTISVYDEDRTSGPDEDAPLHVLPDGVDPAEFNVEYYGALKALCESVVRSTFRHRATILRPGLVAGPYDQTDRFTYWPVRIDAGGEVLVPVSPDEPLQYIDARDLAIFAVHTLENADGGTYNCVVPRGASHLSDLLDACVRVTQSNARFVWVDAQFLQEKGVNPWSDMPLWIPDGMAHRAIMNADASRALVAGLHTRPLNETVRDTLEWARTAGKNRGNLAAGLSLEREHELLEANSLQRADLL
jgi:2'-hydroxyisoflavone reductase